MECYIERASARSDRTQSLTPKSDPQCSPHAAIFIAGTRDGATGFFSSASWPVAYLLATVVLGIALVVGALVPVTQPTQLANPSPSIARGQPSPEPMAPSVGRITGLADCRWADPEAAVSVHAPVSLGHEYALVSGYLEITYDTGAKVILQGPVKYVVESQTGGFLSIGRLTARVEKKGSGFGAQDSGADAGSAVKLPNQLAGAKGERTANPTLAQNETHQPLRSPPAPQPSHQREGRRREEGDLSSLDPHPWSLFSVRTPTAVVTDLGTEFGVEVDKSGTTRSHVFQGKVELRPTGRGQVGDAVVLRANESARVEGGGGRTVEVIREAEQLGEFVRHMPSTRRSTGPTPASGDRFERRGRLSPDRPRHRGWRSELRPSRECRRAGRRLIYDWHRRHSRFCVGRRENEVVGSSTTGAGVSHAFLYSGGKMQDLDAFRGYRSYAYGINTAGQVVGSFGATGKAALAFLYSDGKMKSLGTLGGVE